MEVFPDEYLETVTSPLAHKFYWWGFALLISYGFSGGNLLQWFGAFVLTLIVGQVLRHFLAPVFATAGDWRVNRRLARDARWERRWLAKRHPSIAGTSDTRKGGDISSKGDDGAGDTSLHL